MSYKIYTLTEKKYDELRNELRVLTVDERKRIADELDWIRDISTLREDSAYLALLEEKYHLEKKIAEIKLILQNCEIMNIAEEMSSDATVRVGSRVKVSFNSFQDEYVIVSALEADPLNKKISDKSPVGRALLGARRGDSIKVITETVEQEYQIIDVH